jgi:sensor histidine kinase YesM
MAIKISERTYLFEIAKIAGIVLWYLLTFAAWMVTPHEKVTVSLILLIRLCQALSGYIVISLLYLLFNILDKKSVLSKRSFIFILLPLCCIVSVFWNILSDISGWLFKLDDLDVFTNFFFIGTFFFLTPALAFTGLYYAINHWLKFKIQSEKALMATNLANEAQLQMLRYQINPHFLFNALNTIRLKVEEDKNVARRMITELANFFRYSLSQKGNMVSFENEIKAIKNFLEIQKIRFEEKLEVIYDIDEKVSEVELPFFIVLPLVENAVKYGLQTSSMPLTIKISAKLDNQLTICVQNTGKLLPNAENAESTKTGIMNIEKRLELCYPGNYSFGLSEKDSIVTAEIIIKDLSNPSF